MYYEPHDLNASLSSGSDRGSHAGSGSGSGSSGHVTRLRDQRRQQQTLVTTTSDNYVLTQQQLAKRLVPGGGSSGGGTPPQNRVGSPPRQAMGPSSVYQSHATVATSKPQPSTSGHLSKPQNTNPQPHYTSGLKSVPPKPTGLQHHGSRPPRHQVVPNYLPMDGYNNNKKDSSEPSSSNSGSYRTQDTEHSGGLEDSGIDIGTGYGNQKNGSVATHSSQSSAYSQDEYLLPVSFRGGANGLQNQGGYLSEEQLKYQQLQIQQQQQQLQQLQQQQLEIQRQLLLQQQQNLAQLQATSPPQSPTGSDQTSVSQMKQASRKYYDGLVKSQTPRNVEPTRMYPNSSMSQRSASSSVSHNSATPTSHKLLTQNNGDADDFSDTPKEYKLDYADIDFPSSGYKAKNQTKVPYKNQESGVHSKPPISKQRPQGYITEAQVHPHVPAKPLSQEKPVVPVKPNSSKRHTFAPQQGYIEMNGAGTSRGSVRSRASSVSSRASSSYSRSRHLQDPTKPKAANIILNIPGYRTNNALARSKRLSSAEESDLDSVTSVSVTSREVANIMTQAMRMHRNSSRRRSKGHQCEHHHRSFATKPGRPGSRSGSLSRSSNLRGSNSSTHSRSRRRTCTRCGSHNVNRGPAKPATPTPQSSENLISFIEQSMRSFLLNSSETVSGSTEDDDTSSETKSLSDKNKTPPGDENDNDAPEDEVTEALPDPPTEPETPKPKAPSLYDIASQCLFITAQLPNDYTNPHGYGMHIQQIVFDPISERTQRSKTPPNIFLGRESSAFSKFQGNPDRIRYLYCIHMLEKQGVAAKTGTVKEGDFLIEVSITKSTNNLPRYHQLQPINFLCLSTSKDL